MTATRIARIAAAAIAIPGFLVAGACTPVPNDAAGPGGSLSNHLPVAETALAAGQTAVAQKIYRALAEQFDDAPEPALGLAYIAFNSGNFAAAEHHFLDAASRAREAPAAKAEALLGAGRTALAQRKTALAQQRFRDASKPGRNTPMSPWIENGLAVAAALDRHYGTAEAHYVEALRRSAGHPRIAANLVRMLIAAGRINDAARTYAERDPSFWREDDGRALADLIETSRSHGPGPAGSGAGLRLSKLNTSWPSDGAPSIRRAGLAESPVLLLRVVGELESPGPLSGNEATTRSSEIGAPAATTSDGIPPTALTLTLGQSRRLRLDGDAATVLVASPEVADVQLLSPNQLYIIGKAVGRTSVVVRGNGDWIRERLVLVTPDLEPLRGILADEPDLRGVQVRPLLRGVMLTGQVVSAESADRALRLSQAALPEGMSVESELRVADSQQVNLEVQIAEVQRSITEDLGINWEAFRSIDSGGLGFRVGRIIGEDFLPTTVDGTIAPSLIGEVVRGPTMITGMIDALAEAGLANVLARPNVTAVSGRTASFFSGGEYPLPTGYEDGVIIFKYKKYGVLLDFVPTVIDAGRISLTVRPEVSEPSLNDSVRMVGVDIPVINVRRAETTVEVGDGESIVIAGLFRNASNTVESGVPGLKDVPGLGLLFGRTSIRSDELELIVVVTARLVQPGPALRDAHAHTRPQALRADGFYY